MQRSPSPTISLIQASWLVTLAYTPGLSSLAQPSPQLTTPTSTYRPEGAGVTRGPPLSPCTPVMVTPGHSSNVSTWQESLPGLAAHTILSVSMSSM